MTDLKIDDDGDQEFAWAQELGAEQSFGRVNDIKFPFSLQLTTEIRRAFPADKEIYDDADSTRRSVEQHYLVLRIGTLVLLLAFALMSYGVSLVHFQAEPSDVLSIFAYGAAAATLLPHQTLWFTLLSIGVLAGIAAVLRTFWRWAIFREIDHKAHEFAHVVSRRYQEVLRRILSACRDAELRGGNKPWPERARRWVQISIWNGKRGEYLDRYSTTVAWKIRIYFLTVEIITWILKGAIALVACAAIARAGGTAYLDIGLICGAVLISTFVVWFWLNRRLSDFWTDAFVASMEDYKTQIDYLDETSKVAENLVNQVQANEWNSQTAKGGPMQAHG